MCCYNGLNGWTEAIFGQSLLDRTFDFRLLEGSFLLIRVFCAGGCCEQEIQGVHSISIDLQGHVLRIDIDTQAIRSE
jgi:hypothetical protein